MLTSRLLAAALVLSLAGCDTTGIDDGQPVSVVVPVSPRQTYTLVSQDDALDAPAVSLAGLGLAPGDPVCFRAEGDFNIAGTFYASENSQPLVSAVFSATDRLLGGSVRRRVPDAVEAGPDLVTRPSDRGALDTDIPEDFDATRLCLTVPSGARFVFFAAYDTYYADNSNIPGTPFGVRVEG